LYLTNESPVGYFGSGYKITFYIQNHNPLGESPVPSSKKSGTQSNKSSKGKSGNKSLAPAVEQAAKVLVRLGRGPEPRMTLTEISREVGIHKSKGYSILNTLMQFGFVEKDLQTKTYSLGPGLLFLSRHLLDRLDIRERVAPFLAELAVDTRSTALLGLISADQVFVVAKHEGNQSIGITIRVGHRFHMTSGAHGKAIVAFLSDEERKRILSRKRLFFYGDSSRFNKQEFEAEMEKCRTCGFSSDLGGLQPGINAVSAPVFGPKGQIVGCLILMGPFPESLVEENGPKTAEMASRISSALGANPASQSEFLSP
jgi:DNA-binding IclR family transcriptional regulator